MVARRASGTLARVRNGRVDVHRWMFAVAVVRLCLSQLAGWRVVSPSYGLSHFPCHKAGRRTRTLPLAAIWRRHCQHRHAGLFSSNRPRSTQHDQVAVLAVCSLHLELPCLPWHTCTSRWPRSPRILVHAPTYDSDRRNYSPSSCRRPVSGVARPWEAAAKVRHQHLPPPATDLLYCRKG